MNRLNHILFATDLSPASERALEHAAVLAAKNDARLSVLHVHELFEPAFLDEALPGRAEYQDALNAAVEGALSRVQPKFEVPLERHFVREVSAAPAIVSFAAENGVDLVVVGSHRRGAVGSFFLGSVAQEVVRDSPASVLVVRGDDPPPPSKGFYDRILVPVDFSKSCDVVFKKVMELGRAHKSKVTALHVVPDVIYPAMPMFDLQAVGIELNGLLDHAKQGMAKWLSDHDAGDIEGVVVEGSIHRSIGEVAVKQSSNLVAMGTAGLHGIDRWLMGSVAEKVLRTAPCPVLIVKGDEAPNL